MSDQSARIHDLAKAPGAAFSFDCRLCGRHRYYFGPELDRFLARIPADETLTSLIARMICPECKKPIDGKMRTFSYSRTTDPETAMKSGYTPHGWSGPR